MECYFQYTFVPLYITRATSGARLVAKHAEELTKTKYAHLKSSHFFVPFTVEMSDVMGPEA